MSDRSFYPLIALVVAVLIAVALIPARGSAPVETISGAGTDYSRIVISGANLNRYISDGRSIQNAGARSDQQWSLILKSYPNQVSDNPLRAPHFRLAADLEQFFAGASVRMTIKAKAGPGVEEGVLEINYSTGDQGDSNWQAFKVDNIYRNYVFEWDVPSRTGPSAVDYLALRAASEDGEGSVEIQSISLQRVSLEPKSS